MPVIPAMMGSISRRIAVQADLGINSRPYSKKNPKVKRVRGVACLASIKPWIQFLALKEKKGGCRKTLA
jgi:hypothetical protein